MDEAQRLGPKPKPKALKFEKRAQPNAFLSLEN